MGDHPNAALVRQAMEAFMAGDMSLWDQVIADDVVWHEIGGRTVRGKDALAARMGEMEGIEFSGDLHDVVGNDEHVVALVETNVKTGGKELGYRTAEVLHVSDGKITERWTMSDDTQAITEFFG